MEDDDFVEIYCPTCGSCGETGCCSPTRCKYGVHYINELREEIVATRKALAAYIKMMKYEVNDEIIDQEIEFYGTN